MNTRTALDLHLFEQANVGGVSIDSALVRGLCNVRKETGRDKNGFKITGEDHGSWLGAIGYMAILDQTGNCFKPRTCPALGNENSIQKALRYFTRLGKCKINAIYALRCSLAHDYSLSNIPKNKDQTLQHRFIVTQGEKTPLIRLPRDPWDGNILKNERRNTTVVNLEKLGDLVETVYKRLVHLHKHDRLDISLKGGPDELIQRYQIWT
jgi:hypothetical protein